ncbi:MAG: LAGLIDADG family homing endonuclease [Candidatus Aenigmarchaeota archaeon]|nr:LAGLIDADG family homing endonuclease [Candidatus Aenigmarchaeota archaeon]
MKFSYMAGLIAADGHLEKYRPYVYVYTNNKRFRDDIVKNLQKFAKNKVTYKLRKRVFQIRVSDRKLYEKFKRLYHIKPGKKSHDITPPVHINRKEKMNFLIGFFDGDCSVFKEVQRYKRKTMMSIYEYPVIELQIKSKDFCIWSKELLETYGIHVSKVYGKNDVYWWRIKGAKNFRKFCRIIKFKHPLKLEKVRCLSKEFKNYFYCKKTGKVLFNPLLPSAHC